MADSISNDNADNFDIDPLDLEIEDLDDAEYDLPPVQETPTLESILNDTHDRESLSEDELSNVLLASNEVGFDGSETQSMGSVGTRSLSSAEHRPRRRTTPASGSILRHVILKGISSQLNSACERAGAGAPTALAVGTSIAVGTAHGAALVFDSAQALRWRSDAGDMGAVSCLAWNSDCTRLLAGFARGGVVMYDSANGKALRSMMDVHQPGTAVLHVKWTDCPTLALLSDSGGSVFEMNFHRRLAVRGCDSKCLFSGSRGEVVCLEPLLLDQFVSHPLRGAVLVAMATLSKVLVVSLRPRTRVVFTHALTGRADTLPLIAWQCVVIQMADGSRVVDPVLAFAREHDIRFYQVCGGESRPRLAPLQHLTVSYMALSLRWLNARTMAVLDTSEQLHLVDVRTSQELEAVDLSSVQLVYSSSFFKGLSNGGNVSEALALAGERACYNSVLSFGNQLLVLGVSSFHVLTIRTWLERLELLTQARRYVEALGLARAFYLDQAPAVVGLRGPKQRRKDIARDKLVEILEECIATLSSQDSEELISACVEHCVDLDLTDLLFTRLWEACGDDDTGFLEALEAPVLAGRLTALPPALCQRLVSHYEAQQRFAALEAILVRLDVGCLDVDQVMRLSSTHSLHDAMIHVYTRGMGDYVTPLVDLLGRLMVALATGKQLCDGDIARGNKLLVYISCCLAGRAYPAGEIAASNTVKHEVFKCLTCLHTRDARDDEVAYPYLRALLHFDAAAFINVVELAFQEPEFSTEMGRRQIQRLLDILVQIVITGTGFNGVAVSRLVGLACSQMAQGGVHLDRGVLERAAQLVAQPAPAQTELRQAALLQLMQTEALVAGDRGWLMELATQAGFYRAQEVLHTERGEHHLVLRCYLRDPARRSRAISWLRAQPPSAALRQQVADNIADLVDVDHREAGDLVRSTMPHMAADMASSLQDKQLYLFLKGLVESPAETALPPELVERYIEMMCRFDPASVLEFVSTSEAFRLDQALELCERAGLVDASVHLLERCGRYDRALDLHLSCPWSDDRLRCAAATCRAAAQPALWLRLLRHQLHSAGSTEGSLAQLVQQAATCVPLTDITAVMMKEEHCQGGLFRDVRHMIMGVLSHSSHERSLLESTARLHSTDLHRQLARTLQAAGRGFTLRRTECCACGRPLRTGTDIVVFRCQHGFHTGCLPSDSACCVCQETGSVPVLGPVSQSVPQPVPQPVPTDVMLSREFPLKLAAPRVPPDLEGVF